MTPKEERKLQETESKSTVRSSYSRFIAQYFQAIINLVSLGSRDLISSGTKFHFSVFPLISNHSIWTKSGESTFLYAAPCHYILLRRYYKYKMMCCIAFTFIFNSLAQCCCCFIFPFCSSDAKILFYFFFIFLMILTWHIHNKHTLH